MIKTIIILAAIAGATNVAVQHFGLPKAKMTVRVVNENGQPIENAETYFYYQDSSIKAATDANGISTEEANCDLHGIGCNIKKEGYYMSGTPNVKIHLNETLNRWEPWNQTYTVVLRPIGKLVALYARKVDSEIPTLDKPCGYDLEVGDWVFPYGKGMKSDFIFKLHQDWRDIFNYDIEGDLTFKNALDGLQEASIPSVGECSTFKWSRNAPDNNYQSRFPLQNTWFKSESQKPARSFKFDDREWEGYFFRVHTVEQDGKIVSAHYGKIRGGIAVWPDSRTGKPKISFTYYYNPTPNDQNLEWDAKKDLFGGLKSDEIPREP